MGLASGLILGALIMYYVVKDGSGLRRSAVGWVDPRLRKDVDGSIGGHIPHIGAFLGAGWLSSWALGAGGIPAAAVMLVVILAANLLLENFVEPRVMGRTLHIHPLVVLVVTALGGLVGGIVGLILAVPATVIAGLAVSRLRAGGFFVRVADRAQPAVRRALG